MKKALIAWALLAVSAIALGQRYVVFSVGGKVTAAGAAVHKQQRVDGTALLSVGGGGFVTLLDTETRALCTIGAGSRGTVASLFDSRKLSVRKLTQKYVDYILKGETAQNAPSRSTYRQSVASVSRLPYWMED